RKYEKNPDQVNGEERFNAFSYYMQTMKFVQAERLANDSFGDDKAMRLLLLGVVKLCRGDFEGAVDSLTLAEKSGERTAAELRVPVSCLILRRPEEVRTSLEQMITAGKYVVSAPTAKAVMAYCHTGKDGALFFDKFSKHLQLEPIYLRKGVLENYVWLCRKYKKLDEIAILRELYELRNGPFGKAVAGIKSAQIREAPELEVEVEFQTGKTSTERYFWLRVAQDDS